MDFSGDPASGLVAAEMGWCGCVNTEDIDRWMVDYLDSADDICLKLPEGPAMMLGYIADDLGWTEHGGSVYGAWLTDDGREALVNLRAALERYDAVFGADR